MFAKSLVRASSIVLGVVAALAYLDSSPRHERILNGETIVAVDLAVDLGIGEERNFGGKK